MTFFKGSAHARSSSRTSKRARLRLEPLEERCVPALFIENFSDDFDPAQPGFDTWDDNPSTVMPDEMAIPHQISSGVAIWSTPLFPPAPSAPHFLAMTHSAASYIMDFSITQGQPGGLDSDGEVVAVAVDYMGLGSLDFFGANGVMSVEANDFSSWTSVTVTANSPSSSGRELGAIHRVMISAIEGMFVDNVAVLVLDAGFSNNPPVANDDFLTTLPSQPVNFEPLANDGDFDGDPLTLTSIQFTPPPHGILSSNMGVFTYTPDADFHGVETLRYTISDGRGGIGEGMVRIIVNTPPIAARDEYELPHGFSGPFDVDFFGGRGLLDNDFDADADVLTITAHGQPRHGDVTLTPDGFFQYTPTTVGGVVLPDSFTYSTTDGYATAHGEVFIRVPNAAPVSRRGAIVAAHGAPTPLVGSFAYADGDGDAITASLVDGPDHGQVTLTVSGGQVHVLYETVAGSAIGSDQFTYRLFDGYNFSAVVDVEVRVPNHAPVAIGDHFAVRYNGDDLSSSVTRETIELGDFDISFGNLTFLFGPNPVPEYGVGIDDYDVDGDRLTFSLVRPPEFGTLREFRGDNGRFVYQQPSQGLFPQRNLVTGEVLPEPLQPFGYDWFVYSVSDGHSSSEAVVLIDVLDNGAAQQDAYADLAYTTLANQPLSVQAESGVFYTVPPARRNGPYVVEGPGHGTLELINADGSFIYQPAPGFVGFDGFQYNVLANVQDQHSRIRYEVVLRNQISLIVLNDGPQPGADRFFAVGDQAQVIPSAHGLLANDIDPNGHRLHVFSIGSPAHGRILASGDDGGFTYLPDAGFRGQDTFQYQVSDGHDVTVGTITIEVTDPSVVGDYATVYTTNGQRVVLASSAGTTLLNVQVSATPPATPPVGAQFPLGFFHFEVHGVSPGGAATVRLLLPPSAPVLNEYWKYGPNLVTSLDHWYRFPEADLSDPNEIVLHFVDGRRGDHDLSANGVIVDPGGPAFVDLPPAIARVLINDGHVQRSMVNSLTIAFSEEVSLDSGAVELRKRNGKPIDFNLSQSIVNGNTVVVLTFSGRGIIGGSLPDGQYTLILHADRIHNRFGQALDGDNDGSAGGNALVEFFRRFGDTDGDGDVDKHDHKVFKNAWRSVLGDADYLWFLDYDLNGDIDKRDKQAMAPHRKQCR